MLDLKQPTCLNPKKLKPPFKKHSAMSHSPKKKHPTKNLTALKTFRSSYPAVQGLQKLWKQGLLHQSILKKNRQHSVTFSYQRKVAHRINNLKNFKSSLRKTLKNKNQLKTCNPKLLAQQIFFANNILTSVFTPYQPLLVTWTYNRFWQTLAKKKY